MVSCGLACSNDITPEQVVPLRNANVHVSRDQSVSPVMNKKKHYTGLTNTMDNPEVQNSGKRAV